MEEWMIREARWNIYAIFDLHVKYRVKIRRIFHIQGTPNLKGPFAFFLVITPDILKQLGSNESSVYPL